MPIGADKAKELFPHRLVIKLMTRLAGELYVDNYLPELDEEARAYLLEMCGQHIPSKGPPKPQDPLFCAAMFLAGVSLGDLAMLFNIRKQTIQQKVVKHCSKVEREKLRDRPPMVDLESLALCRKIFDEAIAISDSAFTGQHPLTIGRALLSSANDVIARDRGDEPQPDRPRRYSNMNQPSGKEVAIELVEEAHQALGPGNVAFDPAPINENFLIETVMNKKGELSPLKDLDAPQRIREQDKKVKAALDDFMKDLDTETNNEDHQR